MRGILKQLQMKDRNSVRNLPTPDDWMTPPEYYEKWNKKFKFDFDPYPYMHDLTKWSAYDIEWGDRNFINPPYSRVAKELAVKEAIERANNGALCFCLLPVSLSTKLYHKHIKPNAMYIEYMEGRIPFIGINSKGQYVNYHLIEDVNFKEVIDVNGVEIPKYVKASGQFDSMIVLF